MLQKVSAQTQKFWSFIGRPYSMVLNMKDSKKITLSAMAIANGNARDIESQTQM